MFTNYMKINGQNWAVNYRSGAYRSDKFYAMGPWSVYLLWTKSGFFQSKMFSHIVGILGYN